MSKIKRSKRNTPFVLINKESLQDRGISWQAKGLLAYLLSLPDDWQILVVDLANRSTNGKDSTGAILNELIKAGYIERQKIKDEKNRFGGYDYTVFDSPKQETPFTEKPFTGNPKTETPFTEKPQLLSNNLTNNTITKKPKSETPTHENDISKTFPMWYLELEQVESFKSLSENLQTAFKDFLMYRNAKEKRGIVIQTAIQNLKRVIGFLPNFSEQKIIASFDLCIEGGNVTFDPNFVENRADKPKENKTFEKKPTLKDIPLLSGDLGHRNKWKNQ